MKGASEDLGRLPVAEADVLAAGAAADGTDDKAGGCSIEVEATAFVACRANTGSEMCAYAAAGRCHCGDR